MASITSVGTGSGLDLEGTITKLISAEQAPVKARLDASEAKVQASISALGSLKSSLADFQNSLTKLKTATNFSSRNATSSDSTIFTSTTTNSAELGNSAISVVQLAKTQKLASSNFSSASSVVGTGTLAISVGDKSFNIDITAGTNDSVAGIRDAINNSTGNTGVRASLLTVSDGAGGTATKLVLTSTKSGSDGAIKVAVTGDSDGSDSDNSGLSRLRYDAGDAAFKSTDPAFEANRVTASSPAQDAIITVDGAEARSSSNTFADTIPGVTLTVLKEGTDPQQPLTGTLSVNEDKSGIKTAIQSFVASYNALVGVFSKLTSTSGTDSTQRGLLSGDNSVNVIQARLRATLGGKVEGASADFSSMAALGISTARDGTISIDSAKLDSALNNNYDDLGKLFAGSGGIAGKLDTTITSLIGSGGMFDVRQGSLSKQLDDIDRQRVSFADKLTKDEARYRAQFTALDSIVAQMNQTSSFLTQQMDAIAQITNPKK